MYGDWNYGTQKINVVLITWNDEDSENSFFTPDEWVEINGNAAIKIQKLITFVKHYKVLWYTYQ